MKEHPILFSAAMVRAIQSGQKTQTRRLPIGATRQCLSTTDEPEKANYGLLHIPPTWKIGDRLWVRETWAHPAPYWDPGSNAAYCSYFADKSTRLIHFGTTENRHVPLYHYLPVYKWKPSIHMPRSLSRISLEITGVRAEPLLAISDADAMAEGVEKWPDGNFKSYGKHAGKHEKARDAFFSLWDSIHVENSSRENPWVWVICFRVAKT